MPYLTNSTQNIKRSINIMKTIEFYTLFFLNFFFYYQFPD